MIEHLNFEIELWCNEGVKGYPEIQLTIDNSLIYGQQVTSEVLLTPSVRIKNEKFKIEIAHPGNDLKDVTLKADGTPEKDGIVSIKTLKVEGIDIWQTAWTMSKFIVDPSEKYIEEYEMTNCMDFGFHGRWVLEMESPVYIWLLENL